MNVEKLRLKNFRNISFSELDFDNKTNVICGENAQGKTNIIEALWLFSGAKSFRISNDSQFIKFGENRSEIYTEYKIFGVNNSAKITFGEKKTAYLNEKKLPSTANLASKYNAVIFSPSDLTLVTDGPDKRRRFLDTAIGQLYQNYIEILRGYNRAVMQRNKIIKDYRYDKTLSVMLDVFENEIAESGNKIIKYRKKYIEILNRYVNDIYFGISCGKEEIKTEYIASKGETLNCEMLKNAREKDMYTQTTSIGPHRDDINFKINGISARIYGSQGQKRSVALAIKLAGAEVIKEISGEYPICLLDDVMSELDEGRQNYILNHIKNWQSFITCCDTSNIKNLKDGKIIRIKNGDKI